MGRYGCLLKSTFRFGVIFYTDQQLTLYLTLEDDKQIISTMVYAKYSDLERLSLWYDLYLIGGNIYFPWLVGEDFNVIMYEEKIGGFPIYSQEVDDFSFCINSCKLFDISFSGNPFTFKFLKFWT